MQIHKFLKRTSLSCTVDRSFPWSNWGSL